MSADMTILLKAQCHHFGESLVKSGHIKVELELLLLMVGDLTTIFTDKQT